jgi:hypothetical protein
MMNNEWKDVEGSGHGLIWGTIPPVGTQQATELQLKPAGLSPGPILK